MSLGRGCFWDPARNDHCGFPVKCVSRYLELILWNVEGLGWRLRGLYGRIYIQVFHQDVLSLLVKGAEKKKRPQQAVCYRSRDETVAGDLEERRESESEDLKPAYLLSWSVCFSGKLGWWVTRECLLELWAPTMGWVGRKIEECLLGPLMMGQIGRQGHSWWSPAELEIR